MRRMLAEFGEETVRDLFLLRAADRMGKGTETEADVRCTLDASTALLEQVLAKERCFSLRDLAIGGEELLALGMEPGPRLGRTLQHLLSQVIEENLPNEPGALVDYAQNLMKCNG